MGSEPISGREEIAFPCEPLPSNDREKEKGLVRCRIPQNARLTFSVPRQSSIVHLEKFVRPRKAQKKAAHDEHLCMVLQDGFALGFHFLGFEGE